MPWLVRETRAWLMAFFLAAVAAGAEPAPRLLVPLPHAAPIVDLQWSPDHRRLASSDESGMVKIWNRETGQVENSWSVPGSGHSQRNLNWLDSSHLVVVANPRVEIIDIKAEKIERSLSIDGMYQTQVAGGRLWFTHGGETAEITAWNLTRAAPDFRLDLKAHLPKQAEPRKAKANKSERAFTRVVELSRDHAGQRLACIVDDTWLVQIDAVSGKVTRSLKVPQDPRRPGRPYYLSHLMFASEGPEILAVVGPDRLISTEKWQELTIPGKEAVICDAVYSNGKALAKVGQGPFRVLEVNLKDRKISQVAEDPLLQTISPEVDGSLILGDLNGRLIDRGSRPLKLEDGRVDVPVCWTCSKAGRLYVALSHGDVQVWNLAEGRKEGKLTLSGGVIPNVMTIDASGQKLAISYSENSEIKLEILDPGSARVLAQTSFRRRRFSERPLHLQFSPDGRYLAGIGDPGLMLAEVEKMGSAPTHQEFLSKDRLRSIDFSPDSQRLAYLDQDGIHELQLKEGTVVAHPGQAIRLGYDEAGRLNFLDPKGSLCRFDVPQGPSLRLAPPAGDWASFLSRQRAWKFVPGLPGDLTLRCGLQNTLELSKTEQEPTLGQLISLDRGQNWLVVDSQGHFDGTPEAQSLISWQVGEARYRVEQFFETGYRPGLLRTFWDSAVNEPGPLSRLQQGQPPQLEILAPKAGEQVQGDEVEVRVKVTDQGGGISRLRLFVNGHPVTVETTRGSEEALRLRARLAPGTNELRVTAFDKQGQIESAGDSLRVRSIAQARPASLHLLCVGVNQGSQGSLLSYAGSDADSIAKSLNSTLFATCNSRILTGESATRPEFLAKLAELKALSQPQDTLVIFFAGHGFADAQGYHFVLAGRDPKSDVLSSKELAELLEGFPAQRQLLILDTCHSAAASPDVAARFAVSQQKMARGSGLFLLAACRPEQSSSEIGRLQHGLLTYTILDGLSGKIPTLDASQPITVNSLLLFTSWNVAQLAQRFGAQQDVYQYSAGSDFPLLPNPKSLK